MPSLPCFALFTESLSLTEPYVSQYRSCSPPRKDFSRRIRELRERKSLESQITDPDNRDVRYISFGLFMHVDRRSIWSDMGGARRNGPAHLPRPTVLHDGDVTSASPRAANAPLYQEGGLGGVWPIPFLEPGTLYDGECPCRAPSAGAYGDPRQAVGIGYLSSPFICRR